MFDSLNKKLIQLLVKQSEITEKCYLKWNSLNSLRWRSLPHLRSPSFSLSELLSWRCSVKVAHSGACVWKRWSLFWHRKKLSSYSAWLKNLPKPPVWCRHQARETETPSICSASERKGLSNSFRLKHECFERWNLREQVNECVFSCLHVEHINRLPLIIWNTLLIWRRAHLWGVNRTYLFISLHSTLLRTWRAIRSQPVILWCPRRR